MIERFFPPQIVKSVLFWSIGFLLISMMGFFLALIFHKLKLKIKERKKNRLRFRNNLRIRKFLQEIEHNPPIPQTKTEYEVVADLCIQCLFESDGKEQERIKEYIRKIQLVPYLKKLSRSFFRRKRIYGVKKLGFLQLPELKDYWMELLSSDVPDEIKWEVIRALSFIADREALERITEELSSDIYSAKFYEQIYRNVIQNFRQKGILYEFVFFMEAIKDTEKMPLSLKKSILESCGNAHLKEASWVVKDYFFHYREKPEIRITCIRVLGRLGTEELCGMVSRGLFDEDWRVRAVAARSVSMCDGQVVSHLRNLLYDDSYYVRINAAFTLSCLGKEGHSVLTEEKNSRDEFVNQTVQYMIEK
ncbi:HEAT repeat domain-containing protein [bacterium]|nr:HEAT repeat domain-containing protein [bacterium]